MDSHILWALVICFAVVMYTIFDGFDLGVGILFPFIRREDWRDTMIDSITPVWDGNETWIVLIGVGMLGGFPKAYSILLPALYIPVILMVICLVSRGIAMEFRFQSVKYRRWWDFAFSFGSLVATFCQGIVLGNLMEGIKVDKNIIFNDTSFNFLSPFTLMTGFTLVITYALIGSTWLNFKTTGAIQHIFKKSAKGLIVFQIVLMVILIYGRFNLHVFNPRFGAFGIHKILSPLSLVWYVLTALLLILIWRTINKKRDWLPFTLNMMLIFLSALYIVSSFWPYIVPPDITIFDAGAPIYGNNVLLYSSLIVVPIILAYLAYSYFVFRGKVTGNDNYEPEINIDRLTLRSLTTTIKPEKTRHLSWPLRIFISIGGMIYFFIIIGFLGNTIAVITIIIFIVVFLSASLIQKH